MRDDRVMALHNEILWRDNEIKTKLQRENETVCPIRFVIRAVQPFRRDEMGKHIIPDTPGRRTENSPKDFPEKCCICAENVV